VGDYLFVHEFGHHFAALADEYYTSPVAYSVPTKTVEPWEPNVTALLDRDALKWKHLVATSTPIPTTWSKQAFESYELDVQARRKLIRAERRPESEMDALFREEQAHVTRCWPATGTARSSVRSRAPTTTRRLTIVRSSTASCSRVTASRSARCARRRSNR
jgi:hypothetical protein